ncbi:hypothetical protein [Pseudoduganella umbonata]|uniref:Uncharacterized protein n=1 Tax=Pseudoduganella umbonata TaxID=864828 RepID=A0A4P8HYR3_9BURK|nr:hypothetical protein [Pseudoduganella umbonata]MBB3223954.1 hypothetical protein [Pseudoduganella umbonata]QCP14162.1 hypothetical protein FCL38_29920 [Pseudoduganella umbonata]
MKASFGLLVAIISAQALGTAMTNCAADERILFSCAANKKTISVCVSPSALNNSYVEYRFSAAGKMTFSYRADASQPKHLFQRVHVTGASSASTIIWFENDGYVYLMNDPIKGRPSISVRKDRKTITRMECTGKFAGDTDIVSPYIQEKTNDEYFNLLR